MSPIGIDLAFGLVIIALVTASISAAVLAARHSTGWHHDAESGQQFLGLIFMYIHRFPNAS